MANTPNLKKLYQDEVAPALMQKFGYKSTMQIPRLEKINMVSRHTKPRKQGDQGGILKKEAPLYACKVQKVCPKCNKPTRIGHKVEGGKKTRVCKKCGAEL